MRRAIRGTTRWSGIIAVAGSQAKTRSNLREMHDYHSMRSISSRLASR